MLTNSVRGLTGLNDRDIHYLCRQEWMGPASLNLGTGRHRHWGAGDVAAAVVYSILRDTMENRFTFTGCRAVRMFVAARGIDALRDHWLVMREGSAFVTGNPADAAQTDAVTITLPLHRTADLLRLVFPESESP